MFLSSLPEVHRQASEYGSSVGRGPRLPTLLLYLLPEAHGGPPTLMPSRSAANRRPKAGKACAYPEEKARQPPTSFQLRPSACAGPSGLARLREVQLTWCGPKPSCKPEVLLSKKREKINFGDKEQSLTH